MKFVTKNPLREDLEPQPTRTAGNWGLEDPPNDPLRGVSKKRRRYGRTNLTGKGKKAETDGRPNRRHTAYEKGDKGPGGQISRTWTRTSP